MSENPVLYDSLGEGYDIYRQADPSIAALLHAALGDRASGEILDVGCGTGNYTLKLAQRGLSMTGVDPSAAMLARAQRKGASVRYVQAGAERLPFAAGSVSGLVSVNAILHFDDPAAALTEFARVLAPGSRAALFCNTREEVQRFWLRHYFPATTQAAADYCLPESAFAAFSGSSGLRLVERKGWTQPEQPVDHFLYCGKRQPELYLLPAIRAGISFFRMFETGDDVPRGLAMLAADIASGAIIAHTDAPDAPEGDYSLFIYEKEGGGCAA